MGNRLMKRLFQKLKGQAGFFDPLSIGIGIAVVCIGVTMVNEVFIKPIDSVLTAKLNNPDAITSLSLGPSTYEFDEKDVLIRHGVVTPAGRGWQYEDKIGKWTFAPNGINDPARHIYYEEYEGTSKQWVLAPDGLSSHRRQIYDEERKRWKYVYAPHVEDYLSGKRTGISTIYENEPEDMLASGHKDEEVQDYDKSIEGIHGADMIRSDSAEDLQAQEKVLNALAPLFDDKNETMQTFINKSYLTEADDLEVYDIEHDIEETVKEVLYSHAKPDASDLSLTSIYDKTMQYMQSAGDGLSDLFNRSREVFENMQKEMDEQNALAEAETIAKRKELNRHLLSVQYNEKIIQKYEQLESQGFIISNPSEWAEAERRVAYAQGKIRELEDEIGKREMVAQIQPDIIAEEPAKIEDTAQEAYTIEESSPDFEEVQDADTAFTIIPEDIADGNIVKGTIPESIMNNDRTWAVNGLYTWADYHVSQPGGYTGFYFKIKENGLDFLVPGNSNYYQYSYYLDYPTLYIRIDNLRHIRGRTIEEYEIYSLLYSPETQTWNGTFNHVRIRVDPSQTLIGGGPAECIPTGGSHDFSF